MSDLDETERRFVAGQLVGLMLVSETWNSPPDIEQLIGDARRTPFASRALNNAIVAHLTRNTPDVLNDTVIAETGAKAISELSLGDVLILASMDQGFAHHSIQDFVVDFIFAVHMGAVTMARGNRETASAFTGGENYECLNDIMLHAGGVAGFPAQLIWDIGDRQIANGLEYYNHPGSKPGASGDIEAAITAATNGLAGSTPLDTIPILKATRAGAEIVDIVGWRERLRQ